MTDRDKQRVEEARKFVQKKKELFEKLNQFLDLQIGDGCDWPVVEKEDFFKLHEIVRDVIDLKYERDCDNDSVLLFDITNRKTHYQSLYPSIKRAEVDEEGNTISFPDVEMRQLAALGSWTMDQVEHRVRVAEHERKKKK